MYGFSGHHNREYWRGFCRGDELAGKKIRTESCSGLSWKLFDKKSKRKQFRRLIQEKTLEDNQISHGDIIFIGLQSDRFGAVDLNEITKDPFLKKKISDFLEIEIFIEGISGEKYECSVAPDTKIANIATDFFTSVNLARSGNQ